MLICDVCQTSGHYKLRCVDSVWFCPTCIRVQPSTQSKKALHVKVRVGSMENVSQARIDEMDRRVVLPYTVPGHDYLVGRRNDDGSISDKAGYIGP